MFNNLKLKENQSGFTLIEVLVGILMATAFVLITSQAIALSAVFRVRAQRESEAINWIQEDLENIKFAALIPFTAACDDAVVSTGYGGALKNYIESVEFLESYPDPNEDGDNNRLTRNLLNKPYKIGRVPSVTGATFNVMTLSYSVYSLIDPNNLDIVSNRNVIADLYTEVIPDAAFDCE